MSKRSLRPDPNFDQLVSKLFPDRDEIEEEQEKAGFVHAKRLCKKRKLSQETEGTDLDVADEETANKKRNSLVNFKLICHKDMPEDILDKLKQKERFVETSASATIEHVKAYVKTRLTVELELNKQKTVKLDKKTCDLKEVTSVEIFIKTSDDGFKMLDNKAIVEELPKEKNSPILELYFSAQLKDMGKHRAVISLDEDYSNIMILL